MAMVMINAQGRRGNDEVGERGYRREQTKNTGLNTSRLYFTGIKTNQQPLQSRLLQPCSVLAAAAQSDGAAALHM